MATLYNAVEPSKDKLRRQKHRGRRFLSQLDMSIIKHDIAVKNSEIKRGDRERYAETGIYMCYCGSPGCAIHYDRKS
jgi:hypothetical protein